MILKSPLYSWQVSRCSHYWNWVSNWHKDIYHDSWTQGTHSVAGCTVSGWDEPLWQRKDPRESGTCQGRWCIWIFWGHSWHYQILQGCNLQQNWKEDTLCYPIFDSRFVKHVCQLNCTILEPICGNFCLEQLSHMFVFIFDCICVHVCGGKLIAKGILY